jgi:hypothetical protein
MAPRVVIDLIEQMSSRCQGRDVRVGMDTETRNDIAAAQRELGADHDDAAARDQEVTRKPREPGRAPKQALGSEIIRR